MRREALFSRSGFYGFLLQSNVLLHREATRDAIAAVRPLLRSNGSHRAIVVLDLACGGWPVTIADLMAAYPEYEFHYTGVDINPDQVSLAATTFPFPDNVSEKRLIEGNAWDLDGLGLDKRYSLIFSGMNIHHGTPAEVAFLGHQIHEYLQPGGLFISHDVYRPDETPYLPRPEMIEGSAAALVAPNRLVHTTPLDLQIEKPTTDTEPAWRADYLQRMHETLLSRGADPVGADSTVRHMRNRDYPISTREMRRIMESLDLEVRVQRYSATTEPLGPYVACCVMTMPDDYQ
jgi:SAM-dependent methyltransferase